MIVLLAVFVLMVVIGALADRSRRRKEAAAQPDAPETVPDPAQTAEWEPRSVPDVASQPPQPLKVTVRRREAKSMLPAAIPAGAVVPVGPDSAQDVTARLRRAQRMYDDGVITKREYKRARRRILDSI